MENLENKAEENKAEENTEAVAEVVAEVNPDADIAEENKAEAIAELEYITTKQIVLNGHVYFKGTKLKSDVDQRDIDFLLMRGLIVLPA